MWAPCSAKASTVARPTPGEAPVITTISGFLLLMVIPPLASRLERPDGGPGQTRSPGQPGDRPAGAGPFLSAIKVFGEISGRTIRPLAQGHPQHLRRMQRTAAGLLGDLLAATEARGNDQGVLRSLAHGGEEHLLAHRDRDVVALPLLEAEGAGHAAAAGVEHLQIEPEIAQHLHRVVHVEDRFLMAMAVEQGLALQLREIDRVLLDEEFAEGEDLAAQALGVLIAGEEVEHLIAEDRHAARLQADDRNPLADLLPQRVQDLPELPLSLIEHPIVVERAPATEMLPGDRHLESRRLQHLDGGARRGGMEIVVEGVRPEEDSL